jgi:phage tail protein X
MELKMGSFQQVFMGLTCLAAAFFFGRYMHTRPAANESGSAEVAVVDPIDSLFSMGTSKRPAGVQVTETEHNALPATSPEFTPSPILNRNDNNTAAAAKPQPMAYSQSMFAKAAMDDSVASQAVTKSDRKSNRAIVPDFSDLASRFRHSPLELDNGNAEDANDNPVHASERTPAMTGLPDVSPPELVIRKPQKMTPLEDFRRQVTRVEKLQVDEPQTSERWRVNRDKAIGRFNETLTLADTPLASTMRRAPKTIDEAFAQRSADYLKQPHTDQFVSGNDDYSAQRQQITQRAAERNRVTKDMNLFEVTDPGNRFANSPATPVEDSYSPPRSILETSDVDAVAPPVPISNDQTGPMNRLPQRQQLQRQQLQRQQLQGRQLQGRQLQQELTSIRKNANGGWNRRSNVQTQFRKTYQIVAGDTLQSISTRFYGTPVHYLEIYKANREALARINSAPAGIEIVIPNLELIK